MKKYLKIMLAIILSTGILFSCKKDSTPEPKDYAASIKDKTWSGAFTYTGEKTEYYCVHFNTDNTLLWSQLSGDYAGKWVVNGKALTMTFDANTAQIKADISEDDKLMNIAVSNTGSYIINSGGLIANPNIALDNTVWQGLYNGSPNSLQLSFMPGLKVELRRSNIVDKIYTYQRSASGAVIRFKQGIANPVYPFFCVINSGMEIKGNDTNSFNPFQLTKQ
jgi:hypothetical protein